jgi:hypothetical protein
VISNLRLIGRDYIINLQLFNGVIPPIRIGHSMEERCALVTLS